MNKKEIAEIKKQFTPSNCSITRICGCYVDGEKEKKSQFKEAFLSLPEEEMFKYFDIFRKTLSGTLGKNLLNMDFSLDEEMTDGCHKFLLALKESRLTDDNLLDLFYDRIIESYDFSEHYLILLIHAAYDIPGKSSDNEEMFDASDEVYDHILCSICPVKLSKPGLSYDAKLNNFHDRIRDWIVEMPVNGFLFPAFNDRTPDIHSLLYYSKKPEDVHYELINSTLGCTAPLTAGSQKENFNFLIQETLGDDCSYEIVRNIHENLNGLIEGQKESPEPVSLDKEEIKYLLEKSGVEEKKLETFDQQYNECAGEKSTLLASNITNTRTFEVKTPDVVIKVNPERTDLIDTMVINGRQCIVIGVDDHVEINGISAWTIASEKSDD